MPETRKAIQAGFDRQLRVILVGLTVLLVAVLVVGWSGDYRSCLRQLPVRRALIQDAQLAADSVPYWQHRGQAEVARRASQRARIEGRIRELRCLRVLPGT